MMNYRVFALYYMVLHYTSLPILLLRSFYLSLFFFPVLLAVILPLFITSSTVQKLCVVYLEDTFYNRARTLPPPPFSLSMWFSLPCKFMTT